MLALTTPLTLTLLARAALYRDRTEDGRERPSGRRDIRTKIEVTPQKHPPRDE